MPLKLGLALLLVVAMVGCGDASFVYYHITVTNAGPGVATVGISAKDVKQRAVVPAGTSTTATSFAGGSVLISVSPAEDVMAQMTARRIQIYAELGAELDRAKANEIYRQLIQLDAEIRAYGSEHPPNRSLCTIELHLDSFGNGVDVEATATFDGSRFNLAC